MVHFFNPRKQEAESWRSHESRTAWSLSIVRFRPAMLHSETLSVQEEGVTEEGVGNGENIF